MLLAIMCSWNLQQRLVSDTGRWLAAMFLHHFLKTAVTFAHDMIHGLLSRLPLMVLVGIWFCIRVIIVAFRWFHRSLTSSLVASSMKTSL